MKAQRLVNKQDGYLRQATEEDRLTFWMAIPTGDHRHRYFEQWQDGNDYLVDCGTGGQLIELSREPNHYFVCLAGWMVAYIRQMSQVPVSNIETRDQTSQTMPSNPVSSPPSTLILHDPARHMTADEIDKAAELHHERERQLHYDVIQEQRWGRAKRSMEHGS
jgi:hypothetical protein